MLSILQKHPYLLLILATVFWGSNFVIARVLVQELPPFQSSFARWVVALIIFFPFAYKEMVQHQQVLRERWRTLFLLALTSVVGFNALLYVAVQYTTSINASLVNSSTPMIIVLLSWWILKERMVWIQYLGILISSLGVLWILTEGEISQLFDLQAQKGDLIVLCAVMSWSIYAIIMKKHGADLPRRAVFLGAIILGVFMLFPLMIIEGTQLGFSYTFEPSMIWIAIVYLGIFPSLVSFICWGNLYVGPVTWCCSHYFRCSFCDASSFILTIQEKLNARFIMYNKYVNI